MDPLALFEQAVKYPSAYAAEWKEKNNGRVIATFCSYTPSEIILAANALPLRIFGGGEFSLADTLVQTYCCSLVRGILNDMLSGRLIYADGAVFPHTCDSMQRLSDIWRLNSGLALHLDVVLPVKLNTEAAGRYMVEVIEKFKRDLADRLQVDITDDALRAAIKQVNTVRKTLAALDRTRLERPGVFGAGDMNLAVRAAMIMSPDQWLDAAKELLSSIAQESSSAGISTKKVMLSGGVCGGREIYDIIGGSGGMVVHDDLCTGSRFFEGLVDEDRDPAEAIAGRYRQRIICPAKHAGIHARADYLVKTAREKDVDGVIFLLLKFCDPHAFDYPYLKQRLDQENIPSLLLEAEDQSALGQQAATRTEAFLEML